MKKNFLQIAALLAALAVILGAFGAHSLKSVLPADKLQVFETAVRYQFYHVFALLAAGILFREFPGRLVNAAGQLFIAGIVLFCGSLYALCFLPNNFKWVGAVTPVGGALFIAGWTCLFIGVSKTVGR